MTEKATFGGGCFWCVEAAFERVRGVTAVVSGYAGGHVDDPTYEQVCAGTTGHAEVVQVTYDPTEIGYEDLLEVFFTSTTPRRRTARVPMSARSTARRSTATTTTSAGPSRTTSTTSRRPASTTASSRRSNPSGRSTGPRRNTRTTTRNTPTSPTAGRRSRQNWRRCRRNTPTNSPGPDRVGCKPFPNRSHAVVRSDR